MFTLTPSINGRTLSPVTVKAPDLATATAFVRETVRQTLIALDKRTDGNMAEWAIIDVAVS